MQVEPLGLPGVVLLTPRRIDDSRGWFCETFNRPACEAALGRRLDFVQDNQTLSRPANVLRGLHFQAPPHAQAKLIRVVRGRIFDVAVDIRRGSPTYGAWTAAVLSAADGTQMFVPRGFAHGFLTLEPDCEVAYKVDAGYAAASDRGLRWNDPDLAIDWPCRPEAVVLSERDAAMPAFAGFVSPFEHADGG